MITLDLLRHGEARAAAAGGDAARVLSSHGSHAIERLGGHLGTLGWRPTRAFASPLLRARQTAALVLLSARVPVTPETLVELASEAGPAEVMAALAPIVVAGAHVLLVGHQPLLGDLAGWCTGEAAVALTPGQLVRVAFEAATPSRASGTVTLSLRPESLK